MEYKDILRENPTFEPSLLTKTLWLKTRKKKIKFGEKEFPGFFSVDEDKFMLDQIMIGVIMISELLGIVALFFSSGISYFIPKMIIAVLLVIGDFILASRNRILDNDLNMANNRKAISEFYSKFPDNAKYLGDITHQDKKINEINRRSSWHLFWLLVLAIGKTTIFFWDIKGGVFGWFLSKYIFLYATPILYFIVAFCQWAFFGHWYNTYLFNEEIGTDLKKHLSGHERYNEGARESHAHEEGEKRLLLIPCRKKTRDSTFELSVSEQRILKIQGLIPFNSTLDFPHSLENFYDNRAYSPNNDGEIEIPVMFKIETEGVFTDDDLLRITATQKNASQATYVGIEGLRHQIDKISQSEPL